MAQVLIRRELRQLLLIILLDVLLDLVEVLAKLRERRIDLDLLALREHLAHLALSQVQLSGIEAVGDVLQQFIVGLNGLTDLLFDDQLALISLGIF